MTNSDSTASHIHLADAFCRVSQVQAVLAMWLELVSGYDDSEIIHQVGSVITLLDGVPEVMQAAEKKLADYSHTEMGLKAKK